ncbi:MAG: hypothetical protein JW724_03210 [Candidatus Altiarchaeota archaeon]|nr:hypothetical protein [Candidatus Altiarchaeota archaeon]
MDQIIILPHGAFEWTGSGSTQGIRCPYLKDEKARARLLKLREREEAINKKNIRLRDGAVELLDKAWGCVLHAGSVTFRKYRFEWSIQKRAAKERIG